MNQVKQRNYTPLIILLTILIYAVVALLSYLPGYAGVEKSQITFLPMLNAILNSFTFLFLLGAFLAIKKKNINLHRRLIFSAFGTTLLFLISYVTYHSLAETTHYGGEGFLKGLYLFILFSHIVLSAIIVPLALFTVARGLNMQVERHRKIARWTMPLWLYVSLTGVLVYIMISPYY